MPLAVLARLRSQEAYMKSRGAARALPAPDVNSVFETSVPYPLQFSNKQAGRDLNPQPLVLETSALPIELPT